MELSFGEQIKIILKRHNMTIKDLADLYSEETDSSMSRQNLTQRLKRDNFPEQDMHTIAALLGYNVSIKLIPSDAIPIEYLDVESSMPANTKRHGIVHEGGHAKAHEPIPETAAAKAPQPVPAAASAKPQEEIPWSGESEEGAVVTFQIPAAFRKSKPVGDINPLSGKEYLTNTVRRHPEIEEFVQVYDQTTHSWSDVREDYFWEFQEKKKQMMGADYKAPIQI
jgi:transcriptional regulator with XRE-family HTH domain